MKYLFTSGVAMALAAIAMTARAEDAFTANKAQVGATLGYGIWAGDGDLNAYGFGLGVHGGYTLDMGFHIGGRFEYFFGGSKDTGVAGASASVSSGVWNFMVEPGYDLGLAENMVLRPQLGLGLAEFHGKACVTLLGVEQCHSVSNGYFAIAPGAMFLMDFGGVYGVGGLRYEHVFVDSGNGDGFLINVGAGMTF